MARAGLMCAVLAALSAAAPAAAQDADEGLVVSATRTERRNSLEIPGSIDAVGAETLREGKPKVNLSEALGGVPGLTVQNRQNYAQDLQTVHPRLRRARDLRHSRRKTLSPTASRRPCPTARARRATFDLAIGAAHRSAARPARRSVRQRFRRRNQFVHRDGPKRPRLHATLLAGAYGTRRFGMQAGGESGARQLHRRRSRFHTDGYRDHRPPTRQQFNGKLKWLIGGGTHVTLVANTLYQPETQDPLGLTRGASVCRSAPGRPGRIRFNTRKTARQEQSGVSVDRRIGAEDQLRASVYAGDRQVRAVPGDTGRGAARAQHHSGGVVDLGTFFDGYSVNWIHDGSLPRPPALGHRRLGTGNDGAEAARF